VTSLLVSCTKRPHRPPWKTQFRGEGPWTKSTPGEEGSTCMVLKITVYKLKLRPFAWFFGYRHWSPKSRQRKIQDMWALSASLCIEVGGWAVFPVQWPSSISVFPDGSVAIGLLPYGHQMGRKDEWCSDIGSEEIWQTRSERLLLRLYNE
jgi:hypothetical protein